MNQNETVYNELTALLKRYKGLTWPSESDIPITAVRIPWYRIFSWKRQKDGYEQGLLNMAASSEQEGLRPLAELLMAQENLVSFRKPTKNPAQHTVYILARFGMFWYTGIKFDVIET